MTDTETLSAQLIQRLQSHGNAPCVTILRRSKGMQATPYTGSQLLNAAQQRLNQWRSAFGPAPLTLALALPQGVEFMTSLLAGLIGKITIVPLPPIKPNDARLRHMVIDSGANAVICLPTQLDALKRNLADESSGQMPCPLHALDGTMLCDAPLKPTSQNQTAALIQYTSGSTHLPKGVLISADNILKNCALVTRAWGMGRHTKVLNWLPHYHDMGLMGCIIYPILFGGTSVQMNPLDVIRAPASWLRAVSDHRATISGGPAFAYQECLSRITPQDCEGLDLSSWGQAFCGSEPVQGDLLPRFQQKFACYGLPENAPFSCYGMAESTLFVAGSQQSNSIPKATDLAPCHLTDETRALVQITNPTTCNPCDTEEEGEIWVKGDSVANGYRNLPNESYKTFADQGDTRWLRTGDIGKISGNTLYITGRIKDMLIANGRNIAAREVEWMAAKIDLALNPFGAAAFAPDPLTSGTAVLLIELRTGHKTLQNPQKARTLIERTMRGTLGIKLSDIRFLPRGTLPRTSSGKIRRASAANSYRAGEIPAGLSPKTPQCAP